MPFVRQAVLCIGALIANVLLCRDQVRPGPPSVRRMTRWLCQPDLDAPKYAQRSRTALHHHLGQAIRPEAGDTWILPGHRRAVILQTGNYDVPRQNLMAPAEGGGGMLRDTGDTSPVAAARAGAMMRFARAARGRRRALFLVTGAVLAVLGIVLASAAVLLPGILLVLFALLHGIGSSGCTSADLLAGWPWRG